jgi:hypothetical protein
MNVAGGFVERTPSARIDETDVDERRAKAPTFEAVAITIDRRRGRCALVDVRRPHVERGERELEADTRRR